MLFEGGKDVGDMCLYADSFSKGEGKMLEDLFLLMLVIHVEFLLRRGTPEEIFGNWHLGD